MDTIGIALGAECIIAGLLAIFVLAKPLVAGNSKPDTLMYIKLKGHIKSKEAIEILTNLNRKGGRGLRAWGCILIALGIFVALSNMSEYYQMIYIVAFAPLLLVIPVLQTWMYASRKLR
ncbi:hypothetical protein [Candidatus Methanomassiliicoccus intestinalis]|uniref:hypothetical protein n=1 Tax=Candidatus Methanomassiliicoccus intestinalis TaxID=1406512 RepID=UPI0037DDC56F